MLFRSLVQMTYLTSSRNEVCDRTVEPLGIIFSDRFWYLVAYFRLRHDVRTFRIDRIQNLNVLEQTFAKRKDFSVQEYVARDRSGQRRAGQGIAVRIAFSPDAGEKAKRQIPWRIVNEERTAEGDIVLTVAVEDFTWIVNWVLSFGKQASIREPELLATRIQQHLGELADHHRRNHEGRQE